MSAEHDAFLEAVPAHDGVNHDLVVRVLAHIEREPDTWEQRSYTPVDTACGTGMCFAGWACVLEGYSMNQYEVQRWVPSIASRLLGFDGTESEFADDWSKAYEAVFHGHNTLDDLYRILAYKLGVDETVLRDKVRAEVEASR